MSKVKELILEGTKNVIIAMNMVDSIREKQKRKLTEKVNINTVNEIFKNPECIISLDDKDLKELLELVYNFTGDTKLSPSQLFSEGNSKTTYTRFYNSEFKEEFLKSLNATNNQSVENYKIIFTRTAKFEKAKNKDVYEMNPDEVEEILYSLEAISLRSIQNYISKLKVYVDYAIEKRKTKINEMLRFSRAKEVEKYIDKEAQDNMIFEMDELMEMAEYADNRQDGAIIALVAEGLSYKDKYAELVELTSDDVDVVNKVINLPERIEGDRKVEARSIKVSDKTIEIVNGALAEEEYYSIKGETSRTYQLANSNHVLRGLRNNAKIKWQNINQRILRFAETYDYELLNLRNISYSGQIYYVNKLMKEDNVDIDTAIEKVLKRFGQPVNTNSHYYLKQRVEHYSM